MPQNPDRLQQALLNRPPATDPNVQLPTTGPDNPLDMVLRAITTATGLEEQKPGDLPSAIGGALGAVSMIPPGIAKLRGAKLVEDAVQSGQFPDHVIDAIKFAQQRWPRVFGHTLSISPTSDIPAHILPSGYAVDGASIGAPLATAGVQAMFPEIQKKTGELSHLFIDPNHSYGSFKNNQPGAVDTVGHELLHGVDRLITPDMDDQYQFNNKLPGGYDANSQEIRARLQGARTQGYYNGLPRRSFEPVTSGNSSETALIPRLDSRISGLPPNQVPASTVLEDPSDKLYRIMQERALRQKQGLQDPRVPAKVPGGQDDD